MNDKLFDDINAILDKAGKPVLFSDLVGALRYSNRSGIVWDGRRWSNINERDLERDMEAIGFHFRTTVARVSSGHATYVYSAPFAAITNRYGKTVPVK